MKTDCFHHGCAWFESALAEVGEKGASVVAMDDELGRAFYLDVRPLERDVASILVARGGAEFELPTLPGRSVSLALSTLVVLRHCPGCGARLSDLIDAHAPEFGILADVHKRRRRLT